MAHLNPDGLTGLPLQIGLAPISAFSGNDNLANQQKKRLYSQ